MQNQKKKYPIGFEKKNGRMEVKKCRKIVVSEREFVAVVGHKIHGFRSLSKFIRTKRRQLNRDEIRQASFHRCYYWD